MTNLKNTCLVFVNHILTPKNTKSSAFENLMSRINVALVHGNEFRQITENKVRKCLRASQNQTNS